MTTARTLVVGLGSAHGDDRAGWIVAERLLAEPPPGLAVRRAESPFDLLGWLESVDRLVICDACRGSGTPGQIRRWHWPDSELDALRLGGTHDFGLSHVLELAQSLGILPPHVTVWTIEVETCRSMGDLSGTVAAALPSMIHVIGSELPHT